MRRTLLARQPVEHCATAAGQDEKHVGGGEQHREAGNVPVLFCGYRVQNVGHKRIWEENSYRCGITAKALQISWFLGLTSSAWWRRACSIAARGCGLDSGRGEVHPGHGPASEPTMTTREYKSRTLAGRRLQPETLMMGLGYAPALSEGALKPPIFLTSTFVFETAQQGKDFFDLTAGRREPRAGEKPGLVYSRFNNPNFEILEDRLAVWDEAERSAVFASGMAAIATVMLAFLRPGGTVLHSRPLYGGTETLLKNQMGSFGITAYGFSNGTDVAGMRAT